MAPPGQSKPGGAQPASHSMPSASKAPPLSSAASRSYSVASAWERTAVLSDAQLRAIDLVSEHCAQRPLPQHLAEEPEAPESSGAGEPSSAQQEFRGALEEAVLQNSTQFYKWHSELEAARTWETEEKYRQYADVLNAHLATCGEILGQVDATLALLEKLKVLHRDVSSKTRALHDSCEKLVAERERLVEFAELLRSKLAYFDELERVAQHFHSASLAVDSDHFLPLLKRLDECIMHVSSNPQYAESASYAGKFRQLQARAMATVRTKVQQVFRHAAEQVQAAIRDGRGPLSRSSSGRGRPSENGSGPSGGAALANGAAPIALAEGAEAALLYVRFRAAAEPGLKGLLAGMEARAQRPEYARLLADCKALYCEVRLGLVAGVTRQRVTECAQQPLPALTRNGCAYLMQLCQLEHQLFEHFFAGAAGEESEALAPLMDPLCTILYDTLRPAFIQLSSLDELCELVDILKHEVMDEQFGRRGDTVAPLRPMLSRTLADVQERLTFRAQAFIREQVTGFQPSATDLDYPGKLQRLQAAAAEADAGQAANGDAPDDDQRESAGRAYSTWYPPVQSTLLCLSKLYRCVDARIFAGLAQDAVASCTASVQAASRAVAKASGIMDGQLFVIKQLLILREQIAPFEADFAITEKDLDFGHMRDHVRRIMAGQASLFTLSYSNAMVQMVSRGPRIIESQVDSKKELEKVLKAVCENFILVCTRVSVEPMLSFITKVTAVRLNATRPLRQQAFASPDRLQEMVAKVREALASALPEAVAKMKLYLTDPATHAILFKPIKSNIAEAHGQIAALLESDYTPEEAAQIGLTPPDRLRALLDELS